jgi:hypothetical protein
MAEPNGQTVPIDLALNQAPSETISPTLEPDEAWEEETLADVLNTRAVQKGIGVWQEMSRQQAELAAETARRNHELRLKQVENHKLAVERRSDIERQQLELTKSAVRWLRYILVGVLVGLAALFVYYRETPDVAMKVGNSLVGLLGALGIGFAARPAKK